MALMAEAHPEVLTPAPVLYQNAVQRVDAQFPQVDPVTRARYAALETRMELAAIALARGCTYDEAGEHAGVAAATIGRYMEKRDFRDRVDELRGAVTARVGGRIEAWMDRRTADPDELDQADPKTVLAIYDRIAGRVGAVHNEQTNVTVNNYENLMGRLAGTARRVEAAVTVDDPGQEGGGFPVVGADGPAVAG